MLELEYILSRIETARRAYYILRKEYNRLSVGCTPDSYNYDKAASIEAKMDIAKEEWEYWENQREKLHNMDTFYL